MRACVRACVCARVYVRVRDCVSMRPRVLECRENMRCTKLPSTSRCVIVRACAWVMRVRVVALAVLGRGVVCWAGWVDTAGWDGEVECEFFNSEDEYPVVQGGRNV